ncbi:7-carboxy-7-deazaguanine synthase QueE [Mannheimia varigena]|uniref:7-carboxy-7-deazaguanine synthase QueE n=1 Tax=Mannheimia varigena TaxID=85404 RepID=UPI0015B71E57|nr:7-carboxy-7-deazaguanine synthase QueE [Mannheimia varigena]MDY2947592.1 7-carboxy-7-deazaguanine synthase QueE [Mannheimia varigena]QLD32576.1 7-carboxy-7-deazaguanine synthase QueE [Mannheimia varigena]
MAALISNPTFPIVEIFESLQGEGFNTGMPAIFVRFGKCNLTCPWCDTNYNQFEAWTLSEILAKVKSYSAKNVIITGGEPTIQPNLSLLLEQLKQAGYFLAIETNGLKEIPPQIDYIATSPKRIYQEKYQRRCIEFANEVRIVVDGEVQEFCEQLETQIKADHYYLSPCEVDGKMNLLETITQIGLLNQRPNKPKWQLSIQTHKMVGIE